ncbi:MAG TPA: Tex-like N-terminal domain-containing protein, partial [Anaerolineales bacterium]|nr:Tex-like N-terminal domain-containing protein [Anaerolineales bacterium]
MSHSEIIATLLQVKPSQVEAVIKLLDDGNTVPFIARYRKEMTGSLDDEQIRIIADELTRLRGLDERRAAILASIEEQGKLTDELRAAIESAATLTALEDLYAPYKKKRRTRAMVAREKGLEPLADLILKQGAGSLEKLATKFLNEQVSSIEEALQG